MRLSKAASLCLVLGLVLTGAAAENEKGHEPGGMMKGNECITLGNCICHMTGTVYKVRNLASGVTLTLTSKDPAVVKKLQETARKLAETKDVGDSADERVTCPVMGTRIDKSKAVDKVEYKGQTYYFCCQGCKPAFLKDPEKYIRKMKAEASSEK